MLFDFTLNFPILCVSLHIVNYAYFFIYSELKFYIRLSFTTAFVLYFQPVLNYSLSHVIMSCVTIVSST